MPPPTDGLAGWVIAGLTASVLALTAWIARRYEVEAAARAHCEAEQATAFEQRRQDYERHLERYHALGERTATVIERLAERDS